MGRLGFRVALGCAAVSCAIAAALVGRRLRSRRQWSRAVELVREFEEACATPVGRLRQVVDAMAVEMHAGLASDGGSKLKMLLTFIDKLPDGSEEGTYYALDLGATNFRTLRVHLGGKPSMILNNKVECQPIPKELMTGTIEELFNFVALTLKKFVQREEKGVDQISDNTKDLGFTFSFPVKQLSVSSGLLIKWTKGFSVKDDVNDTVGTLALCHYGDEDTVAAVIIGTGTNACYLERTDAIIKCQGLLTNSGVMVVNMEWGNFWSSHLPKTSYDISLDNESSNPNDQGFEKMISGMYLGEIVRRVLHRIAEESEIFSDAAQSLSAPFVLRTPLVAAMHEDDSPDLREVGRILEEHLKMYGVSKNAKRLIVHVCDIVTRRAARLAAAGIVGILKKLGRDGSGGVASGRTKGKPRRTVVAVEGGLYTKYSIFREYLNEAVGEILGEEVARYVLLRCVDGSGIGAALLAATYLSANR
ncbi:hexokinase-3-like isoform X3 [Zingiber officinale]|uniref:hexokinase-3-like isoform X3 n=1 Tax=Zingiber officinale TaxID=94328 RepID=UPI001C4BDAD5|nr:hexokinase-3-like isoform X3 [Zingiber officinale]